MKFRKKPVVIEAVQFNLQNMEKVEAFVGGDFGKDSEGNTVIATLEGAMKVSLNDWVIKGVKGEFYPCKPDIFEKTYEKVDERSQKKATIPGPPDELSKDTVMVANKTALENITKSFEEK